MDDTGELAFREENVKAHGIKLRSKLPVLKWKIKKDESTAQNASGTIPVQRNRGTTLRIARNSFKRLRSMGKQQSISSLGEDDEEDDTETADETGVAAAPRPRRSFRASFNKRAPPRLTLGNASSQGRGVPTASSQQGSPAGSPEGSVRTHGERGDNQYSGGDDDGGGDANANIHDDKNSGGHNVSGKDETKVDQIERGGAMNWRRVCAQDLKFGGASSLRGKILPYSKNHSHAKSLRPRPRPQPHSSRSRRKG